MRLPLAVSRRRCRSCRKPAARRGAGLTAFQLPLNCHAVLTEVGTDHVEVKRQYLAYLQQYRWALPGSFPWCLLRRLG